MGTYWESPLPWEIEEVSPVISRNSKAGFGDQKRSGISVRKGLLWETEGEIVITILL